MKKILLPFLTILVFNLASFSQNFVWINEFSYDDAGNDDLEFIEVAGTAGTVLTDYKLYFVNGNDSLTYQKVSLSALTIPNQKNGYGAVTPTFTQGTLQNGPDGIALVYKDSLVIQFLSYEGVLNSKITTKGTQYLKSTDIGVSLSSDDNNSVQLTGSDVFAPSFTWVKDLRTPGSLNANQTPQPKVTGLETIETELNIPFTVQKHKVTAAANVEKIYIYSLSGNLVKSLNAEESVDLASNIYIVSYQINNVLKSVKVLIGN